MSGRSIPAGFYKEKRWREVREFYFNDQFGICERCGEPGYIVHHKEYLTMENYRDPEVAYGLDNLELLCIPCHNNEHYGDGRGVDKQVVAEGLEFGPDGRLVQVGPSEKEPWEW